MPSHLHDMRLLYVYCNVKMALQFTLGSKLIIFVHCLAFAKVVSANTVRFFKFLVPSLIIYFLNT